MGAKLGEAGHIEPSRTTKKLEAPSVSSNLSLPHEETEAGEQREVAY